MVDKEKIFKILDTQFPYISGAWKNNLAEQILNAQESEANCGNCARATKSWCNLNNFGTYPHSIPTLVCNDWLDREDND